MSLGVFVVMCAAIFGLLHFAAIPSLRRSIRVERSPVLIGKVGTLALCQTLRSVAFVAALTAVGVAVLVTGAALVGRGFDVTGLASLLDRLRALRNSLGTLSTPLFAVVTLSLTIILAVVARRNARKHAQGVLESAYREAFDDQLRRHHEGTIEPLPPTQEMERIRTQFEQVHARAAQVEEEMRRAGASEAELEETLRRTAEHLGTLQAGYVALDIGRRVQVNVDPDQILEPPPASFREKLGVILRSRGLVGALSGTGRGLYYAMLVLLVPALLGFESTRAAGALARQIVSLEQLQVSRSEAAARRQFEAAVSRLPDRPPQAQIDSATLDVIARTFEDAAFARILSTHRSGASLVSYAVRREILSYVPPPPPGSPPIEVIGTTEAPDVDAAIQQTLEDFERARTSGRPATGIGRTFRQDLVERLRRYPALGDQLMRDLGQTFLRPANTDDISRKLVKSAFGMILEGSAPDGESMRQITSTLVQTIGPDDLRRAYRIQSDRFLAELARGSSLDQAVAFVLTEDVRYPRWTSLAAERLDGIVKEKMPMGVNLLEAYQPALRGAGGTGVDMNRAVALTRDVAGRTPASPAVLEAYSEAVATFDDWFPAHYGADTRTPRGRLLATMHPDAYPSVSGLPPAEAASFSDRPTGGPMSGPNTSSSGSISKAGNDADGTNRRSTRPGSTSARPTGGGAQRAALSATRARSFGRLRGFARVGGVLIGRQPSGTAALDFRDLDWRIQGDRVTLTFVRSDGTRVSLPAMDAGTVHRALLYTADGRPLTVTMVTARPLAELKVLVHPALLDTPLGNEAIELDRLVDIYTGDTAQPIGRDRRDAQLTVHAADALYQVAWAERAVAILSSTGVTGDDQAELAAEVRQRMDNPSMDSLAAQALALPPAARLAGSPVFTQSAYYERSLVELLKQCADESSNMALFRACIGLRAASRTVPDSVALRLPPGFTVWSGVREREFTLDPDLAFAMPSHGSPLQFMLQVAFTTAPAFDGEVEADAAPWEFPTLRASIETAVRNGVRANSVSAHAQVVADLEAFTRIQRLFRVALAHGLGRDFPLERLADLARETRPYGQTSAHTPRWNPRPAELEMRFAKNADAVGQMLAAQVERGEILEPELQRLAREFAARANSCFRSMEPLARLGARAMIVSRFDSICDFEDLRPEFERLSGSPVPGEAESITLRALGYAYQHLDLTRAGREIRRALQVERDER